MNNLKDVLQNLKSDKIKERQEGISSIRSVFSQDRVVENFHINRDGESDPRAWLSVFQALFQAVLNEKLAATKATKTIKSAGSAATAQRRLADAASAVRWLTERTAHLMNKRIVKALFEHLIQTMVHKGELLMAVALDYAKALRCLTNFTPHLEHMESDTWVRIVEMGFNVILDDPIRATFDQDVLPGSPAAMTDAGDLDDDLMDDEDVDALPSTSRKRNRSDSNDTQRPSSKVSSQAKRRPNRQGSIAVTLEQVEFMSILAILLRSSSTPLLSSDYPFLSPSILVRFQRFLDIYPADSSLLQDYVSALSSVLLHLALNRTHDVAKFARSSWDGLIGLWGTKNKRMKEGLVAVLRVLFPFITSDNDTYQIMSFDCAEGIGKLWHSLDGEAESRWGVEGLSLDSLRLQTVDLRNNSHNVNKAFVAETFRAGWNFDAGQALAWSILELRADCAGKLFQLQESMGSSSSSTPGTFRAEGKRIRLENPITSLLSSIQRQHSSSIRSYHLQTLLFFITRHWLMVHDSLQQEVTQVLLQSVSYDDPTVQSWVFLCFAAVAYAGCATSLPSGTQEYPPDRRSSLLKTSLDMQIWDSVWTNAIRRANVPVICRAACHTAFTLLKASQFYVDNGARAPLSSQRILTEIETLGKDLDVQGPSYPYDSVCSFLSQCLRIASQDMRLYRMQLEEKVLSWLVDCWKVVGMRSKRMSLNMVEDLMLLLESICGLNKRTSLASRVPLPDCQIAAVLTEQAQTKVISDFILNAQVPAFGKRTSPQKYQSTNGPNLEAYPRPDQLQNEHLAQPQGRERKVTAFLLKTLEGLTSEWEENHGTIAAETTRQSLDMAVIALAFESALSLNGTQPSRRLVQCAAKLACDVTSVLRDVRWTVAEKALISLGIDPLVYTGKDFESREQWEVMIPPDIGTGIKSRSLASLRSNSAEENDARTSRMSFLRIIWQNPDIHDAFEKIAETMRNVLQATIGGDTSANSSLQPSGRDDKDGFGPIRTMTSQQPSYVNEEDIRSSCTIMQITISILTVVPVLQSGEPTRDKTLTETVLACAENHPRSFFLVFPIFLDQAREQVLNISVKHFDSFLNELSKLLQQYAYARSPDLQLLAAHFLDSTLDMWASQQIAMGEVLEKVRDLCEWLALALSNQKIRSWAVRDILARFLDRYLLKDPHQIAWPGHSEDNEVNRSELLPTNLLPKMNSDEDIRVRFRAAVIAARLFAVTRLVRHSVSDLYNTIRQWYTVDIDNYEHMLTRMLSLGNIMVISSAVRRGPYWHLLETCTHSPLYSRHIESILRGVSERMGLETFSVLFTSYASQLAFSMRKADTDILRFPPHLLGYRDRKACAELTFRSFTPTNIWNRGEKLFEGHCKIVQKTVKEGLHDCFGDILGYQIVAWIDGHDKISPEMEELLMDKTFHGQEFEDSLAQNMDGITAFILHTLGDQDFSANGPIVGALRNADSTGRTVQTFQALTQHRRIDDVDSHTPNLPAFPTETVIKALSWMLCRVPGANAKATTYHILHQLFADIEESPLVNEQNRLVNAISLWIALYHEEFNDSTLLHTLIHGTVSLLAQPDLARASQSILEWSFDCYRWRKLKDSRFPDILIRIACLTEDYARDTVDPKIMKMGNDLSLWIDAQAYKISKVTELRSQVLRALPAWPHEPSVQLAKLHDTITIESLSGVLEDHRMSSNKFRLVRRLHAHVNSNTYHEDQFTKTDFWRLKECIPSIDRIQEADINAFVALLFAHKGVINSFGSDRPDSASLLKRHRRNLEKCGTSLEQQRHKGQEFIILTLLQMLQSDSATQVYTAYQTLRLIKSTPMDALSPWPPEYQTELQFLEAYRRPPKAKTSRDIQELMASELFSTSMKDFKIWIASITNLLSEILSEQDLFYAQFTDILKSDSAFAEQVFPALVHALLLNEKAHGDAKKAPHGTALSLYFSSVLLSDSSSVSCLRSIVDVMLHLRHSVFDSKDALCYNKWLDIDFALLARSAILCGAYTTALLFLELTAEDQQLGMKNTTSEEEILYEIYRHIDEPDGFYGIVDNDLHQFLLRRFHHEKQWEKAFRFHGAILEGGGTKASDTEGLVKSFHSFGFDRLAIDALQSSSIINDTNLPSMSYRLGWRTETWDLPDLRDSSPGESLYLALRAIHRERDSRNVDNIIRTGLLREMGRLRVLGPENFAEIRDVVQDLMCLHEVARWRCEPIQTSLISRDNAAEHWHAFVEIDSSFEFSMLENIMATRVSLIKSVRQREERQQIGTLLTNFHQVLIDLEQKCLVRLSEAARGANQVQIALNSILRAQMLGKASTFALCQEFASVLWHEKEEEAAVQYLSRLASDPTQYNIRDSIDDTQMAVLLARLGTWSSEACLKKPADIMEQFFNKASGLLDKTNPTPEHSHVYHDYAIFAEHQYKSIISSADVVRWRVYVDRKQQEIQTLEEAILRANNATKAQGLKRDQDNAKKILSQDMRLFGTHNTARDTFLKQAIEMYSQCLKTSDSFNTETAIRLCSLWFANFDDDDETGLQDVVQEALERIPSHKLVFLAHQLSARISKPQAGHTPKSQESLQNLVVRMCSDHPFHSLYQVYCLKPEQAVSSAARRQSGRHAPSATQTERSAAAGDIFNRLRSDSISRERVRQIEKISEACLQWAKYPIKGIGEYKRPKVHSVPEEMDILKLSNLQVPVMTNHTPLDPTMRYDDCPWVERFENTFETAGGVNLPKVSICYDTSGKKHKQLFKGEGNDDLRQDAVMEQVFELVNSVLSRDRETQHRDLSIRCYKVIPLSSQAGVLEFVGNTLPLSAWLPKAHAKYHPDDLKHADAARLVGGQKVKAEDAQRLKWVQMPPLETFRKVKEMFRPVMRHYFTERHKTPIAWFAMRLKYTRSVATTSIVGHVLGLGDRHISNILLDNSSGEVVHIDLGIAFDQGKLLPIPELVPFRMTRDMVDGMGTSGTRGVFQRCAEETLRVLRQDSEIIMTVLEVFKHDPLHSWTASELKVQRVQRGVQSHTATGPTSKFGNGIGIDMNSGTAEEAADRALSSVARKLDKSLSVQYTVNQLITDATHEENLARIFAGWSAHC